MVFDSNPTLVFLAYGSCILFLLAWLALQWVRFLESRLRTEEIIERYEILKATNDSLSSTIGSLLSKLLRDINDTNELLNQIPSSSREGKNLYKRLLEELQKIQSPEIHMLIIRSVNDANSGIVDLFKTHFPELAERQITTFAMCAGHVSPKIASLILDIKPKTFYMRRERLREAISQAPHIDNDVRNQLLCFISSTSSQQTT